MTSFKGMKTIRTRILAGLRPDNARALVATAVLGVAAGLSAVVFMILTQGLFARTFAVFAGRSKGFFLGGSFLVLMGLTFIVCLLLRKAPEAAGSGIPQLKAAFWREMGHVPLRSVLIKFVAGVLSIGGGNSLGREGPSVYLAGGAASNLSALWGVPRRERRGAAVIGAAAGLAAAFNTPLAAITFTIEEIIGDFNSRYLGRVILASVLGAFVVHALLGRQPAFILPPVAKVTWLHYLVVPFAAAASALAGVFFRKGALALRSRLRRRGRSAHWLAPMGGALLTWIVGAAVFWGTGKIGVFGLGYEDLSAALGGGFPWKIAGIMAAGKLAATIFGYGFGGSGGIFAPSLFIGGMTGYLVAGLAGLWISLSPADHIVLAAVGMSACLGALVRAPMTSLLIVFEMTHQFELVPGLMIAMIVSQGVARLCGPENFYDALLVQDGHELHKIRPPLDLQGWRRLPVSALANPKPAALSDRTPRGMRDLLGRFPYAHFPVIEDGALRGVVSRKEIEEALRRGEAPQIHPAAVCRPEQTVEEVGNKFIASAYPVVVLVEGEAGPVRGIITLHDLIRAQADFQS